MNNFTQDTNLDTATNNKESKDIKVIYKRFINNFCEMCGLECYLINLYNGYTSEFIQICDKCARWYEKCESCEKHVQDPYDNKCYSCLNFKLPTGKRIRKWSCRLAERTREDSYEDGIEKIYINNRLTW